MVTTSSSQSTQILTHFVVVKSEIDWAMPVLFGKPSPFLEISLAGQQSYVTNTKSSTITPVWNESLELWMLWLFVAVRLLRLTIFAKEIEWSYILSIHTSRQTFDGAWTKKIHRFDATQHRGFGRTWYLQFRLLYYSLVHYCSCLRLTLLSSIIGISIDLFEKNKKTAVVMIHFRKDEPPPPYVVKPKIPANVPPELRPDFEPPQHPTAPEKRMQYVGYQSQDISKDQVNILLKHLEFDWT